MLSDMTCDGAQDFCDLARFTGHRIAENHALYGALPEIFGRSLQRLLGGSDNAVFHPSENLVAGFRRFRDLTSGAILQVLDYAAGRAHTVTLEDLQGIA